MARDIYISEQDLYRMGNSSSPKFDNVRVPKDVRTFVKGDKIYVIANGKGLSVENYEENKKGKLQGWVWLIPAKTAFPIGLLLVSDNQRSGHYFIAPAHTMPIQKYMDLLRLLSKRAVKLRKEG